MVKKQKLGPQKQLDKTKKKTKQTQIVIMPIGYNITELQKFCLCGDFMINVRWFSDSQQLRVSESYDEPFKGVHKITVHRDKKIIEALHYSKTLQQSNYSLVIKQLESLSNASLLPLANRLKAIQDFSQQQKQIALTMDMNKMERLFQSAKEKANQILKRYNELNIPFTYAIQCFNFQFNQLEKTYNGINFSFLNFFMDQTKSNLNYQNIGKKATTFFNSLLDLCFLVDPFNLQPEAREVVVSTFDGVVIKALCLQISHPILPFFLYTLKVRLLFFDTRDLIKLKKFRETCILEYPLQYGLASGTSNLLNEVDDDDSKYLNQAITHDIFIDYSPDYETHDYFSISKNMEKSRLIFESEKAKMAENVESTLSLRDHHKDNIQNKNSDEEQELEEEEKEVNSKNYCKIPLMNSNEYWLIIKDNALLINNSQIQSDFHSKPSKFENGNDTKSIYPQNQNTVMDIENAFQVSAPNPFLLDEENKNEQSNSNVIYEAIPLIKPFDISENRQNDKNNNLSFISLFYPSTCTALKLNKSI